MTKVKAIILAAGQGTRLRPLTDDKPKAMVELNGLPLLLRQKEILKESGVNDIFVVTGYKEEKIAYPDLKKYYNPAFASTNMVASLYCARELFNGETDIIISYGDIVYESKVINALLDSKYNISVIVDKNWYALWEVRMEEPLSDAETLKTDKEDNIIEIGKKPESVKDIQGQYIGLIKISKEFAKKFFHLYESLDKKNTLYDGKDRDNMYMTTYLQLLINNYVKIKAVYVHNGWIEVDSLEDLSVYEDLIKIGSIKNIIAIE